MDYVYQDENLKIYKDNDERYVPRIKVKSFLKIFDSWATIATSQMNDRPVGAKNLEDALILGDYFYKTREKIIPHIEETMDMKPEFLNKIVEIRKSIMTPEELKSIKEKASKAKM